MRTDLVLLARFRRVKLSAFRKKIAKAPEHAEAVLRAAGFEDICGPNGEVEHLEWGPDEQTALPPLLAVLVLMARIQEKVGACGPRAVNEPLNVQDIQMLEVASLTLGGARLLEPRAGAAAAGPQTSVGVEGALVRRTYIQERLPHFAKTLEENPAFFDQSGSARNALFDTGARTRNAIKGIHARITEERESHGLGASARLTCVPVLMEAAHIAASAALVGLRNDAHDGPPPAEPGSPDEPGHMDADALRIAGVSGGVSVADCLLEGVPAFRLGLTCSVLSEVLNLREFPSFFTAELREKQFEVSVQALCGAVVDRWVKRPQAITALLNSATRMLGIGCSLDISNDDKAIIYVILA